MRTIAKRRGAPVLLLAVALAACGAEQVDGGGSGGWADGGAGGSDAAGRVECYATNECPIGWTCSELGTCEPPISGGPDGGGLPPEVELELGQPQAAERYLYVGMPESDTLVKIDGTSLTVATVPVGDAPEVVRAIPGGDDAIALDTGSATATIVRPTVDRDERVSVRTLPRLNALAVDPTGRAAIAWFDLRRAIAAGVPVTAIGSFQDVTVVGLVRGAEVAVDLSVGFRPREVEFDAAGTHAYVITDDGVSVIDLAAALAGEVSVAAAIPVVADPLAFDAASAAEVEITSDGRHAVARVDGEAWLTVTELTTGVRHVVTLAAPATDVDLLPDGSRALALLRDADRAMILDLPGDAIDPSGAEVIDLGALALGGHVGSATLSADGRRALLYTNATAIERVATLDLAASPVTASVRVLQKAVRTAGFAPDGRTALILHSRTGDGSGGSVAAIVDASWGYSVLDLDTGFVKLTLTPVDPGAFAFAPDAGTAYLALSAGDAEGAISTMQVIDLRSFVVEDVRLGSPPELVGVLPAAGVAFVTQAHPLGRVTFVPLGATTTRTITGFELNSHIVD